MVRTFAPISCNETPHMNIHTLSVALATHQAFSPEGFRDGPLEPPLNSFAIPPLAFFQPDLPELWLSLLCWLTALALPVPVSCGGFVPLSDTDATIAETARGETDLADLANLPLGLMLNAELCRRADGVLFRDSLSCGGFRCSTGSGNTLLAYSDSCLSVPV